MIVFDRKRRRSLCLLFIEEASKKLLRSDVCPRGVAMHQRLPAL